MKNCCVCKPLDSLSYAALSFQYLIACQKPGALPRVDLPAEDVRDSPIYLKSMKILKPIESAFESSLEDNDGPVCPYLVLLRGLTDSCSGGQSSTKVSRETVKVLSHITIGAIGANEELQITNDVLDRLQCFISGRFVPNWVEP